MNLHTSTDAIQKLFIKLENPDVAYQNYVKRLAKHHFRIKAIIQDILACRDSMETLNELNEKGRAMITQLRDEMESLYLYGKDTGDEKYLIELEAQRNALPGLLQDFKEANIRTMFELEKIEREQLLKPADEQHGENPRKRKPNQHSLLDTSTGVTDKLLSISRQLADTTQRSQETLDSLVSSSSTVQGTKSELQNTASTISQSSKLLTKYGRREFTDKVIMFFAFLFFLAVCLYIVQKRLF